MKELRIGRGHVIILKIPCKNEQKHWIWNPNGTEEKVKCSCENCLEQNVIDKVERENRGT